MKLKKVKLLGIFTDDKKPERKSTYVVISDEQVKEIKKELGIVGKKGTNTKTGEEYPDMTIPGKFFESTKVYDKFGAVIDSQEAMKKLPFSTCDLIVDKYDWTYQKRKGVSMAIRAFKIIEESTDPVASEFEFEDPLNEETVEPIDPFKV
jgi:hypothetical protein